MSSSCTSRKIGYESYAEALTALAALEASGQMRGPVGRIYTCPSCNAFHVTSRILKMRRAQGRGKKRRRAIGFEEGA